MALLRSDAIALGMTDLAVVYGWSLIRLVGEDVIQSLQDDLEAGQ